MKKICTSNQTFIFFTLSTLNIYYAACIEYILCSFLIFPSIFIHYRSPWCWLSHTLSHSLHEFLLRWAAVSGLFRRHGNQVSRLALLRHWWPTSVLPVSKWHTIFTSRLRVRLVVQRALWSLATSLRHQCTTLSTPQGESDTPTSHHYEGASWWYLQLSWTVRQQRL